MQGSHSIRISNKENIPQAKKSAINLQSSSIKIIPLSHRPAFTLSNDPLPVIINNTANKSARSGTSGNTSKQQSSPEKENVQAVTLRAPLIDTSELELTNNILGKGLFGCVVLEKWIRNGSEVAVKKILANSSQKYLIHKIKTMDTVCHPNVISLMAVSRLSKISDSSLTSALNTTVGRNSCGTPMYMASEILIYNSPASTNSDVWSMSCCFVELFTEESIWFVKPFSMPNLRTVVIEKKKPNLDEIPSNLRSHVSQCFDHNPSQRSKALSSVTVFERQWNGHRY
ncbi:hypothetical protein KQX54_016905 [Cotesia glomerata]|uniref:Protein kinase domain-containing protein n=1 Tax=Cotesia glomerata TaxID=32391 RepID=A0AAV7J4P4_COTGL|nr:hypothetical protein KQX54_016905 [Cotesia glomerata]